MPGGIEDLDCRSSSGADGSWAHRWDRATRLCLWLRLHRARRVRAHHCAVRPKQWGHGAGVHRVVVDGGFGFVVDVAAVVEAGQKKGASVQRRLRVLQVVSSDFSTLHLSFVVSSFIRLLPLPRPLLPRPGVVPFKPPVARTMG